jgi:hypothetical protein
MAGLNDNDRNLHLDELDKESRKQMFNKFVEKGGKVVDEKKEQKPVF